MANLPVVNVIMAGGSGERFWPVSRQDMPKQLLYLTNPNKRMIEEAIDRLSPLVSQKNIFVATNARLLNTMKEVLKDHPQDNIIGEPLKRNTTGCLAFAAAHILARYDEQHDDVLMAVTTADHLIRDEERFLKTVSAALYSAEQHEGLVTIGVQPTRPETGYGYIQISESHQNIGEYQDIPIYKSERFLEKPNLDHAREYFASRLFFWNSGMFFWKLSTFMNSLQMALPYVAETIHQLKDRIKNQNEEGVKEVFKSLPDISIDYGLMEKANNVYLIPGDFQWDDVGSWDALSRYHDSDENNNTLYGDPVVIDCQNVTVYNEPGADKMAVSVIGVENLDIITTKDGILVCPKGQSQDVRKAVKILKDRESTKI